MSEKPRGYPTLAEFDQIWRANRGRDFYAIICETLGNDEAAYEELTNEAIAEGAAQKPARDRGEVLRGLLRSMPLVISDPVLQKNSKKMRLAQEGMVTWLNLLKRMQGALGGLF